MACQIENVVVVVVVVVVVANVVANVVAYTVYSVCSILKLSGERIAD